MLSGLILGDNLYDNPRTAIGRANGAHRIATILRQHFIKVEVIDFFNSWTLEELEQFIYGYGNIDFIGLSIGLGVLNEVKVNEFTNLVKLKNPNLKIIAGGSNVLVKNYNNVDMFYRGFAEGAVPEIIKFLKTGKNNSLITHTIKTHDVKKVIDCNKAFPNFHLSNLLTRYTDTDFIHKNETLTLEFSRGCIFKCSFCNFPLTGKNKNDYIREKEDIKKEIEFNYYHYGITKYLITDDTFNDNDLKVDMLYQITSELDFQLYFVCYIRVDLLWAKKDSLKKLYESGVRGMFFGLESLTPATSKLINKGFTGERLKNYLNQIRLEYPKLHLTTSLIIGLPLETLDMIKSNIQWLTDNNISNSIHLNPLSIVVDNKINYISPFSLEYEKYGYQVMTDKEINDTITNQSNFLKYKKIIDDGYTKHEYPWKNNIMNFLDAKYGVEQLSNMLKDSTTISGWFGFAQSFYIENNNEMLDRLFIKKNDTNWDEQIKETFQFVKNYISKKIESVIKVMPDKYNY